MARGKKDTLLDGGEKFQALPLPAASNAHP